MSAISISSPFPTFTDVDGDPLESGYIYVGQANVDPVTFPITVYWDAALTIPAAQPIRTIGGYPARNGSPARIYANSDYSIRVTNKNGSLVYSAPAATDRFSGVVVDVDATDVAYTPAGTGAIATTVQEQLRKVVYVSNFIPAGVNTATTDCATYIQAAINEAAGKTLYFDPITYKINSSLLISSHNTKIEGRGAALDHYGSSFGLGFGLVGGAVYPVEVGIRQLSITVNTPGASGVQVRTSYSQYEEVGVLVRASATDGNAWILVGDEANGTGPYYNVFMRCTAQSASGGTDHIGWNFVTAAPAYRGPNSNQWFGGRTGQFETAFLITGTGNHWFGHSVEGAAGIGTNYKFVAPAVGKCTGNIIFGGYCENALVGFDFGANTSGNAFYSPYITGVTTLVIDAGTDNYWVSADTSSRLTSGVKFGELSNDANVLDFYQEGAWTPTLVGGTTAGDYTVTTSTAKYTRVGNLVTVSAVMAITVNSAGTGPVRFGVLPFPKSAGQILTGSVHTTNIALASTIRTLAIESWTTGSDSTFTINGSRDGTTPINLTCADILAGAQVAVTITYFV